MYQINHFRGLLLNRFGLSHLHEYTLKHNFNDLHNINYIDQLCFYGASSIETNERFLITPFNKRIKLFNTPPPPYQ